MSALTRRFAAALAMCALAGCGLNLLYPRLDSVVGFYLQDLVTLDDAQAAALKHTLAGNLEWHRRVLFSVRPDERRGCAPDVLALAIIRRSAKEVGAPLVKQFAVFAPTEIHSAEGVKADLGALVDSGLRPFLLHNT
jgi:hypothetical protein